MKNKIVVILGQTASGKTNLSIRLAKKFKGEIISADSRQIYKGLDIGSGKITKKEMMGIPHHLLSVADPKRKFTVAQFQKLAFKKIKEIQKRDKITFLVGGSGFYIKSIVDEINFPNILPNYKLRKELSKKSADELFSILKKINPLKAKKIDKKNPVRIIRAIEIALGFNNKKKLSSNYSPISQKENKMKRPTFEILQIGIKKEPSELKRIIQKRLKKRIKGIIAEVKKLKLSGLSSKRFWDFGLEYRYTDQYLKGNLSYREFIETLEKKIWRYAKRQMTWFKKDKRIYWIENEKEAIKLIKNFLKK